jgi:hypothetical protein
MLLRCTMYIDPNTGGVLFKALAAVFAVFTGVLLVFSGRIRGFFARCAAACARTG